VVQYQLVL